MYKSCALVLVGSAFLVPTCPAFADGTNAKEEKTRLVTAKPTYRVLYNQDDSNFFQRGGNTPKAVQRMVDEVAAGGADVFLVNPNSQRTSYPSKAWQTYWEGYKKGDRSFFGDIPENTIEGRIIWVESMMELAQQGDYLATALARCHERGIAPGVSVRMNDMHDAPWPNSHLFNPFWKQNPQFRLKPWPGRSWGAEGLDYAHPEVREYYLSLIRELAQDYDFDVMELDFTRFPYYFSRDNIDRHCKTMTGFIREVRQILDSTGRHIALVPRIASSPGAARQLGFDVQAWAKKGLIDGITAAHFLSTAWDIETEQFRSLVGPEVAIYVGTESSADRRDGLPTRFIPESYEMLRGFAAGHLAAGADGVNTFNFFLVRQHIPGRTAQHFFAGLRQMRSLEEARNKPRVHLISADAVHWRIECDMPVQVPLSIRAWTERQFEMLLAAEGQGQKVQALVYFDGKARAQDLWLRIGLHYVGPAVEIRQGPQRKKKDGSSGKCKIAVFNVPSGVIKDGRNQLIIRSEKVSTTILGIDVHVR
tara:strand:- start:5 stop:1606 length:1602 start_codon:yes stop_codon:yes gene_type:complete